MVPRFSRTSGAEYAGSSISSSSSRSSGSSGSSGSRVVGSNDGSSASVACRPESSKSNTKVVVSDVVEVKVLNENDQTRSGPEGTANFNNVDAAANVSNYNDRINSVVSTACSPQGARRSRRSPLPLLGRLWPNQMPRYYHWIGGWDSPPRRAASRHPEARKEVALQHFFCPHKRKTV